MVDPFECGLILHLPSFEWDGNEQTIHAKHGVEVGSSKKASKKALDGVITLHYKVSMKTFKRTIAIIELLLVLPAFLFMIALFLREVQPLAQTGRLVEWYSHHVVLGLDVFLIAMPLAALLVGRAMVLRSWRGDAEFRRATLEIFTAVRANVAFLVIAGATLMAGGILALVAMHMMTE